MGKNYDLIASVEIDIASPLVDDTSFDNLLILGPGPKGEHTAKDVSVYASIDEVTEAGFVVSGDDADPVGVAARVAFSQSPAPSAVYIAIQKPTEAALAAQELIETMNDALDKHTTAYEKVGCSVSVDKEIRHIEVTLTVPFAQADGHGLFQALDEFVKQGYKSTVDGITVEHYGHFKQTVYDAQLLAMQQGDAPITFYFDFSKEGVPEVTYAITVSYPAVTAEAGEVQEPVLEPINAPEKELEDPVTVVQRALETNGWYVLCTAGVNPSHYEDIAAYIETQEKMFVYTEMDYFHGETPCVGEVYFRTAGIFGREYVGQPDEEVPEANWYMNVAWVAKWLSHESGSETAAFKVLSAVYPSDMSAAQMKALEGNCLSFFVKVGNKNVTMNGKTMAGEWCDIIRFRDWLKNDMQVAVANLFIVNPKIPYTDSGIALVQNQMIASLKRGRNLGGIAEDEYDEDGELISGFVTSVPLAASIPASEKASRKLRNCKFKARLAGAIHFAEITGNLVYEL